MADRKGDRAQGGFAATQSTNMSLDELLNDGLLLEKEVTKRQRKARENGQKPPSLTSEQIKMIGQRASKHISGSTKHSKYTFQFVTHKELEEIVKNGFLAEESLTTAQLAALKSGQDPPGLSKGQAEHIADVKKVRMKQAIKNTPNDSLRKDAAAGAVGISTKITDVSSISSQRRDIDQDLAAMQMHYDYTVEHSPFVQNSATRSSEIQTNFPPPFPFSANSHPWNGIPTFVPSPATAIQRAALHTNVKPARENASTSSNGRPHPTSEYLQQASKDPLRLQSPQPMLVISDLNGTLLIKNRKAKTPAAAFRVRPGLTPFLSYIMDLDVPTDSSYTQMPSTRTKQFVFMLWTSAQPKTAETATLTVFPAAIQSRMAALWARDTLGLTKNEYSNKTQVYKRLSVVWSDVKIQGAHPNFGGGGRWDQSNTVLIDDSSTKAVTEPFNLINIPELTDIRLRQEQAAALEATTERELADRSKMIDAEPREKGRVGVLRRVAEYLDEARWYADVSAYIRCNPFGTEHNESEDSDEMSDLHDDDLPVVHDDDGLERTFSDEDKDGGVKLPF